MKHDATNFIRDLQLLLEWLAMQLNLACCNIGKLWRGWLVLTGSHCVLCLSVWVGRSSLRNDLFRFVFESAQASVSLFTVCMFRLANLWLITAYQTLRPHSQTGTVVVTATISSYKQRYLRAAGISMQVMLLFFGNLTFFCFPDFFKGFSVSVPT